MSFPLPRYPLAHSPEAHISSVPAKIKSLLIADYILFFHHAMKYIFRMSSATSLHKVSCIFIDFYLAS